MILIQWIWRRVQDPVLKASSVVVMLSQVWEPWVSLTATDVLQSRVHTGQQESDQKTELWYRSLDPNPPLALTGHGTLGSHITFITLINLLYVVEIRAAALAFSKDFCEILMILSHCSITLMEKHLTIKSYRNIQDYHLTITFIIMGTLGFRMAW